MCGLGCYKLAVMPEPILDSLLADAAAQANSPTVDPLHVFLALLAKPTERLESVFSTHAVDPNALRDRMIAYMNGDDAEDAQPSLPPDIAPTSAEELLRDAATMEDVFARFATFLREDKETLLARALAESNVSAARMAVMLDKVNRQAPAPSQKKGRHGNDDKGDKGDVVDGDQDKGDDKEPKAPGGFPSKGGKGASGGEPPPGERKGGWPKQKSLIEKLGRDLTKMARDGELDPVVGRADEIKQVVRVLLRKGKSCPVLVGDPGVGKTSVVYGLAQRLAADELPDDVKDMRIIEISPAAIVAGTRNRGDLEEKLTAIVKSAEADPNIVLFLDDIHVLVGGGPGVQAEAATVLKPALARGGLRCVGTTTVADYRKNIEKDGALERRVQPVRVEEPTHEETLEILRGLRPTYEDHHNVEISDEALDAAIELAVKHIPDRRLPDKARDLIDQAAVGQRFLSFSPGVKSIAKPTIRRDDVAAVCADWTGIPVGRLTENVKTRLLRMEDELKRRVMGQDHAIDAISRVIRTARAGLAKPGRPHGIFLFLGPTGVGKTETARALAEFLFDDEHHLLRFDMSEYMEKHSISKLIGSPPGYVGHEEGGRLTDALRRSPYSVVLFDEIEKAHPAVADLFLQIFDDGRLTDAHGRVADFSNATIIMTSNLGQGSTAPKRSMGFATDAEDAEAGPSQDVLRKSLEHHFRPELLNRLSHVVMFRQLEPVDVRKIIDKLVGNVQDRLAEQEIKLVISESAYDVLLTLGYDKARGAREMDRVIERRLVHPLADGLLSGEYPKGTTLTVTAAGDRELKWEIAK